MGRDEEETGEGEAGGSGADYGDGRRWWGHGEVWINKKGTIALVVRSDGGRDVCGKSSDEEMVRVVQSSYIYTRRPNMDRVLGGANT